MAGNLKAEKEMQELQQFAKEAEDLEAQIKMLKEKSASGQELTAEEKEQVQGGQATKRLQELKKKINSQKFRPVIPKIEIAAIKVRPPKLEPVEYYGTPSLIVG